MNQIVRYRVLMIVLTILLIILFSIMANAEKQNIPQKSSSGKILVSGWCKG